MKPVFESDENFLNPYGRSDRRILVFVNIAVIVSLSFYAVLNYGFMQLRIPPVKGGGIPVAELVLSMSLLLLVDPRKWKALIPIFPLPFLIWWGVGLGRALGGLPRYGMWSLRDASHVIESLFLLVGFLVALYVPNLKLIRRWIPYCLIMVVCYSLTYPFEFSLRPLSILVPNGSGQSVPLLFNYMGTQLFVLLASFYLLIFRPGPERLQSENGQTKIRYILIAGVSLLFYDVIALFQARTIDLQIIGILILFFFLKKPLFRDMLSSIALSLALLFVLPSLGIHIKGRLGFESTPKFLFLDFKSLDGKTRLPSEPGIDEAQREVSAGGIPLRIRWWKSLFKKWTATPESFLFGLGYGVPLTHDIVKGPEYTKEGQLIREPHNSYISVLARIGLVGGLAFIGMHFVLLRRWRNAYRKSEAIHWVLGKKILLFFLVFFVLVWINAIGEDAFEKPFFAFPYYFIWGVVLAIDKLLQNQSIRQAKSDSIFLASN